MGSLSCRPLSKGKSLLRRFLEENNVSWEIVMWVDADAFFNRRLPCPAPLLEGYDVLIDAHRLSAGEAVGDRRLQGLRVRSDDAFFSAGWWVARRGCLLQSYLSLADKLHGGGRLWDSLAFTAAIYEEKLRIRTVCGNIWHARGATSLQTCEVHDGRAWHGDSLIFVVHSNACYRLRNDGRRILKRKALAKLQDHYEAVYRAVLNGSQPPNLPDNPERNKGPWNRFRAVIRRLRDIT